MTDSLLYVLDHDKTARPVADVLAWAAQFEGTERRVAFTELPGGVQVSTVFLGVEHGRDAHGAPLLFESMIFEANGEGSETRRYATWAEAEAGHAELAEAYRWG